MKLFFGFESVSNIYKFVLNLSVSRSRKQQMFAFLVIQIWAQSVVFLINPLVLSILCSFTSWSMKSSYITDNNVTEKAKAN